MSAPIASWACSSCGCAINADWASQGVRTGDGSSLELRFDAIDQNDLRSGTGRVDAAQFALPADRELQRKTSSRTTTLIGDRGIGDDWGVTVQVPYLDRVHTTIAAGDTEISTSHSSGLGDVRLLGRYEGGSAEHDGGVQFGVKLPTGRTDVVFRDGPQVGQALDRGLQPGSGTVDVLLGAYRFGVVSSGLDYFVHALVQWPLRSHDEFKPGAALSFSAGLRYVADGPVVPHLQVNVRTERKESGANADAANSGATIVDVSPGATWTVSPALQAYGFVQLPVFQRVSGLQIEPKLSVTVGLRTSF